MDGIANQAYSEVERKLSTFSYQISLKEHEVHALENGRRSSKSRDFDEDDKRSQRNPGCLANGRNAIGACFSSNQKLIRIIGLAALNIIIVTYLAFASLYWVRNANDCEFEWCDGYGMLLLVLFVAYGGMFYYLVVKKYFGSHVRRCFRPLSKLHRILDQTKYFTRVSKPLLYLVMLVALVVFLVFDTVDSRERLISFSGVIVLMTLGWVFSKHPAHIDWRPVIWGITLQFLFGLFTIRWSVGRAIFQCLADKVSAFLAYAKDGASFVFSENLVVTQGVFAFSVLPVIFFFSFMIQILYYWGVMQWVVLNLGWVLHSVMGTTVCESVNAAANTFLGMTESPLLIKPFIRRLTKSEIHAVMCSGFATVSGTVLAAYIDFGAEAAHLITASVMSAPAALCFSKLVYPETEKSKTTLKNIPLAESEDSSVLDAATKGALAGIPLVLGIIANIVAFISFVSFANALTSWLGGLVGYGDLSFELILSKIFMPLSWLMGIQWEQCEDVGTLIGLKTVINEFSAYQRLGEFKAEGRLSARTEAIATYAICGFANPGSVGIMIGGLTSLAPEKREQISSVALRAFISGSAVCFLTACVAGTLMTEDFYATVSESTVTNSTRFITN